MDFGKLTFEEIAGVDFTLPPDPSGNEKRLPGKSSKGKIYFGMPKWGPVTWIGPLYPARTKEKDFLSLYAGHFNAVELNATHYRVWSATGLGKWAEITKDKDFKFCPKLYQGITHRGSLKGKENLVSEFIKGVEAFGKNLGPTLVQLSDSYSAKRKDELFRFLESLPTSLSYFLETRHPSLVNDSELYNFLSHHNIGSVITDTAGRRDCAHMNLTIPKTMIRFVATRTAIDQSRIDAWCEKLKYWLDNCIGEIYFFLHTSDDRDGLNLAKYAIDQFNEICDAKLTPLLLKDEAPKLF